MQYNYPNYIWKLDNERTRSFKVDVNGKFGKLVVDFTGASCKIVAIDQKKQADSEKAIFNFYNKKISVYGVNNMILEEIQKFPAPIQRMLNFKFPKQILINYQNSYIYTH